MMRAMYNRRVVDKNIFYELMDMLGLKETVDGLAKAIGVKWYGHVMKKDDDSVLRVALDCEGKG